MLVELNGLKIVRVQVRIIAVGICLIRDLMERQSFTEEQNETKETGKRLYMGKSRRKW